MIPLTSNEQLNDLKIGSKLLYVLTIINGGGLKEDVTLPVEVKAIVNGLPKVQPEYGFKLHNIDLDKSNVKWFIVTN